MGGVIVVGVDSSETASKAAECARDLAVSLGASLHVVTAFETERAEIIGRGTDQIVISEADSAERVARKLAGSAGQPLNVTFSATRGASSSVDSEGLGFCGDSLSAGTSSQYRPPGYP